MNKIEHPWYYATKLMARRRDMSMRDVAGLVPVDGGEGISDAALKALLCDRVSELAASRVATAFGQSITEYQREVIEELRAARRVGMDVGRLELWRASEPVAIDVD